MQAEAFTIPPSPWRRSFLLARAALARDDWSVAHGILDRLAAERPEDLEVKLYAAWLEAKTTPPTPEALQTLEDLALRVLVECQALAVPLCVLGDAALRRSELRTAGRLYRRALEVDPGLLDARRGCKVVEERLRRIERSASHRPLAWLALHRAPLLLLVLVAFLSASALLFGFRLRP
jgi:hypothetical protein